MNAPIRRVVAIGVLGFLTLAGRANADAILVDTIAGNDCAGVFGKGFENCVIPSLYDEHNSPVIIKFDQKTGGVDNQFESVSDYQRRRVPCYPRRWWHREWELGVHAWNKRPCVSRVVHGCEGRAQLQSVLGKREQRNVVHTDQPEQRPALWPVAPHLLRGRASSDPGTRDDASARIGSGRTGRRATPPRKNLKASG